MIFFLNIIIDVFFILLPNILYIVYVCNKQNLNEDANKTILDSSLLISLLLIIMFNNLLFNKINIIFIFLIFLISLKDKRTIVSILIALISIEFIHNSFEIGYLIITLLFMIPIALNIDINILGIIFYYILHY